MTGDGHRTVTPAGLPQQRCNCLRLGLDELRHHREGSMMPSAPRFARQDCEFSVLALSCQLWVSCLLILQRSRETCSVNISRECVRGSIAMY